MKRYLFVFDKYKSILIGLALLAIVSSLLSIVSTYYGGMFIDTVIYAESFEDILWICLVLLGLSFIGLVLRLLISYIMKPTTEKLVYELKQYILSHLKKIPFMKYKEFEPSYLSKRIDEDSRQVTQFFADNYATVAIKGIELVVVSFLVLSINLYIGLLMAILCPIYFFIYRKFRKPIFEKSLEMREKSSEFFQDYTQQLDYMEDIVIEANFPKEEALLDRQFSSYYKKFKEYVVVNTNMGFLQGFVVTFMQVVIFFIGGLSVLHGHTTIGLLSILMVYFNIILGNISYYVELARKYQINKSAIHRMDAIMNIPKQEDGESDISGVSSIDTNVSYSINGKTLLNGVTIKARKGEAICIRGANGVGKSTLLKIMMGIIRLNESSVVFNKNYSINSLDIIKFRNKELAYVPQKIRFRNLALRELFNEVSYFADYNDALIFLKNKDIIVGSDIDGLISANWDKQVNALSGGDRQLIAILYNLMKGSSILIMDEPTSNLDQSRLAWFKELVVRIKKNKIVIIVSHDDDVEAYDSIITIGGLHDYELERQQPK